jgi:hypothetical protein
LNTRGYTQMAEVKHPKVKLDWSRLLGFDQASLSDRPTEACDLRLAKIGTKAGTKFGVKGG